MQLPGQLIPAGLLVIVPVPADGAVTVNAYEVVENFAPTVWALIILTLQLAVPEQAPVQPANVKFAAGFAVRATFVPRLKSAVHVPGQLMPAGVLVIVPTPAVGAVTVNAYDVLEVEPCPSPWHPVSTARHSTQTIRKTRKEIEQSRNR